MAHTDRILVHPGTGDIYEFLETAQDTGGRRVTVRFTLKTTGRLVPDHIHLDQDEHFEVKSGAMSYMLDGQLSTLEAGGSITLPKGRPHNHYNGGGTELVMIQTVEPAFDFELLVRNLMGLARDGKLVNGNLKFMQAMVGVHYLDGTTCLAGVPVGMQRVLAAVMAPVGRMLGYRALYKEYCGVEK